MVIQSNLGLFFIVQVKIKENYFLSAAVFCICPVDKRNGRDYIYLNTKEVSLSFYSNSFTMNLRQREQFLPVLPSFAAAGNIKHRPDGFLF